MPTHSPAEELLAKYQLIAELRACRVSDGTEEERRLLRELAATWPGALRELDRLPTHEIDRRIAACTRGDDEPWMRWMARYHALMRLVLRLKRGDPVDCDLGLAAAVENPPHGRLNAVVFARLAEETGERPEHLWETLFPATGRAPRGYRTGRPGR